jgi:hypothetical protein
MLPGHKYSVQGLPIRRIVREGVSRATVCASISGGDDEPKHQAWAQELHREEVLQWSGQRKAQNRG